MLTQHRTSGFSLTELIVVLGICALLAAVLFPVFNSARRKAQESACVTNLQQLSHAFSMYMMDNDGAYPPLVTVPFVNGTTSNDGVSTWRDALQPYLGAQSFPACPFTAPLPVSTPLNDNRVCGYACNAYLSATIGTSQNYQMLGLQGTTLLSPALTVAVCDARAGLLGVRKPDNGRASGDVARYSLVVHGWLDLIAAQVPAALRHHGGANYAFADGHAKWLKPEQLGSDKKSDGINPGFGL